MNKYFQKQQKLHQTATNILKDLKLVEFLGKFGEVHLVGSYVLELLSHEDIDIKVNSNQNLKNYLDTVNYLFSKPNVYSLSLQDFRKSIYPNRPAGLYIGVTYLVKPKTFWKIDIWFFGMIDIADFDYTNKVLKKLTPRTRQIILRIKNQMRKYKYGKQISGVEVYNAVLDHGILNLKEFKKYNKTKR